MATLRNFKRSVHIGQFISRHLPEIVTFPVLHGDNLEARNLTRLINDLAKRSAIRSANLVDLKNIRSNKGTSVVGRCFAVCCLYDVKAIRLLERHTSIVIFRPVRIASQFNRVSKTARNATARTWGTFASILPVNLCGIIGTANNNDVSFFFLTLKLTALRDNIGVSIGLLA